MKKILFAVLVLCTVLCFSVSAEIVDYGSYNKDIKWSLDDEGLLTISGSGHMNELFMAAEVPWYEWRSSVKTVVIEDGITSIGHFTFTSHTNLTSVYIPDSVEIIGDNSNFGEQYRNPFDFTRNYLDTGIQLFGQDIDKDFVLAIDYEFTGDTENSVLAQCYRVRSNSGFQLLYNDGARLKWNSDMTSSSLASKNQREMLVIQHKKGESNIRIYSSNLNGKEIYSNVLVGNGEESQAAKTDTLIFGCEKQSSTSFGNYASGKIYWAKLWEKDIGEEACRELAAWTHEDIELQACGFGRYYVANTTDDEKSSFSLLATHLLDRPKRWNPAPTKENGVVKQGTGNVGGWAASELNEFLNTRLYNAMPSQIKSLIKQVEVKSSVGNSSKDVGSSNCYIMIPSVFELDSNGYNSSPYNAEGSAISYMINSSVRQRAYNDEMQSVEYWTRSPYLYSSPTHSSAGS